MQHGGGAIARRADKAEHVAQKRDRRARAADTLVELGVLRIQLPHGLVARLAVQIRDDRGERSHAGQRAHAAGLDIDLGLG